MNCRRCTDDSPLLLDELSEIPLVESRELSPFVLVPNEKSLASFLPPVPT